MEKQGFIRNEWSKWEQNITKFDQRTMYKAFLGAIRISGEY